MFNGWVDGWNHISVRFPRLSVGVCLATLAQMPRHAPLAQASWHQLDAALEIPFHPPVPEYQSALCGLLSRTSAPLRERVIKQHNPTLLIGLCRNDADVVSILAATLELTPGKDSPPSTAPK